MPVLCREIKSPNVGGRPGLVSNGLLPTPSLRPGAFAGVRPLRTAPMTKIGSLAAAFSSINHSLDAAHLPLPIGTRRKMCPRIVIIGPIERII